MQSENLQFTKWQKILKNQNNNFQFSILLPPPNITGSLHIGHFLNWSIQDILIRNAYQEGLNPKWLCGLDHSGIATEFVVEKQLLKEGLNKFKLGKQKFLAKIETWKETAFELIENQSKNFFMNWEEKRFTMDAEYQIKVRKAFVKLYKDGLITQQKNITNWDIKLQTALSDLEVIQKTEKKIFYYIKFKSANSDEYLTVATTRPETMLGDTALCAHPDKKIEIQSTEFIVPLINRKIPLVKDKLCSEEKGSGILKVTPSNSLTDYLIAKNHNLPIIEFIDKNGLLYNVPKEYEGLNCEEARKKIIAALKEQNLIEKEEEHEGFVPFGEKSDSKIETILTNQWFLNVNKMAQEALKVVEENQIQFYPENLKQTFKHWMENIKPWCISRQIWWGHQIPIWYTEDGLEICAESEEEALKEALKLGKNSKITQSTDVLDTWFSSALWPEIQKDLKNNFKEDFEPTDILVTGKDILFFWVARMIMFSLYFHKKIPFKKVYFNPIVRDSNKQKMSKTKGNGIDPNQLNEHFENDAIRFGLIKKCASKDITFQEQDIKDGQFLSTKFKNAAIFINDYMKKEYNKNQDLDNWMIIKIKESEAKIKNLLEEFSFPEICQEIMELFWNNFCSWYLEGLKLYPSEKAFEIFFQILKICHPYMPFITEECYNIFNQENSILDFSVKLKLESINNLNFENIIKAVKFLRKIKKASDLTSFYSDSEINLIKHYTKLEISKENDLKIKIHDITLYINKEKANNAKNIINKEIYKKNEEINKTRKLLNQNNIPENIKNTWHNELNNLIQEYEELNFIVQKIEN